MWVAKIKISGEKALLGSRAKKFNVTLTGYPISSYKVDSYLLVTVAGLIFGEKRNKDLFFKDLGKAEGVIKVERKGDFAICLLKQPLEAAVFYNPRIIHIKPAVILSNGLEIWEIGSWDKKEIIKLFEVAEKKYKGELIRLKEESVGSISILKIFPELTAKQKKALELAVENGYYEYPKKIGLKQLAKMMGVSYSTYQAHLKKAESRLIPFVLQGFS